jgi:hypothetical protein
MKTDFSQPKFTGARFDDHTLPVDVARDLAAYESLIVDLAKHLYRTDHPDRQRIPKGFASNFHLDISRIDEGSAKPMLVLVLSGALALVGGERDYFDQARDLVAECIAAPEDALPEKFPKELLAHFNQLGRSLREGESLELPRQSAGSAVLTPDKRKKLVLAADQVYEKEVDLLGSIAEVDWEKSSFRLRLVDGSQVHNVPMPDFFHNKAREYGGKPRHQVALKGVAAYDSWDRLQKLVSVESLEVVKNWAIATRMDELAQMRAGWFEGEGVAPDPDKLAIVADKLVADYPERLMLPSIVPTQDGNLLLEWTADGSPSLDILLGSLQASFHAFGPDGHDIERDFNLESATEWQSLFGFLGDNIRTPIA